MNQPPSLPQARRHDLDWLRLIAILILLFFHTGMLFVPWSWHIKNAETSDSFRWWMVNLHEWRMPLLLFISGAGTWMALGKRTISQFAGERFRRLFIPLVFGMFVIVPPQIYFEHITRYSGYGEFYKTVFEFVPYPEGSFSWHHLWFVAYLLLYALIAVPLLRYLRSDRAQRFNEKAMRWIPRPTVLLFLPSSLMVASQALLRPIFPDETHALIDDWAYFVFYFCFFLFGIIAYAVPGLWEAIGRHRRTLLIAAAVSAVPYYLLYAHFRGLIHYPFTDDTVEIIFDITAIYLAWFWILALIALGQGYLNRAHPILPHVNEGLYPFYILHQTVIITIGYYICQLDWSIAAKFWSVSMLTLSACLLIYFVLIRPFWIVRFFFGMKTQTTKQPAPPAPALQSQAPGRSG
jgi:peptidoglycan/LPS O-acetylase OafA/YrhL